MPFGWTAEYYGPNGRGHSNRSDKKISLTVRMGDKPSDMVARGLTTISLNGGKAVAAEGTPGYLPLLNRSVFQDQHYLRDAVGGSKPLEQFTEDDIIRAVDNKWNGQKMGIITAGIQEPMMDNDPWCVVNYFTANPYIREPQYSWIAKHWGLKCAQNPGVIYLGPYDGCFEFNPQTPADQVRNAYSSNQAAYNFVIQYSYSYNQYFRDQLWRHHDCLVNQYHRAATDMNARYCKLQCTVELILMALQHVKDTFGFDRNLCVFVFLCRAEILDGLGHVTRWHRELPEGKGEFNAYTFMNYSFGFHLELGTTTFLSKAQMYFSWDDTNLSGRNPTVVPRDYVRESDGFGMEVYTGNGATRGTIEPPYDPAKNFAFPMAPAGYEDTAGIAREWMDVMDAHAGLNTQKARHRPNAGAPWCSLTPSYSYERFLEKTPIVKKSVSPDQSKIWINVTKFGSEGPQLFNLDVDLLDDGSSVATVEVDKNIPNIYLLTRV